MTWKSHADGFKGSNLAPQVQLVTMIAGYVVRDPKTTISTAKSDFIWDEDEIDHMKQQRLLEKTFNRRRDEQTHYVECKAMYDAMMGKPR